jgi:hypothetical protein
MSTIVKKICVIALLIFLLLGNIDSIGQSCPPPPPSGSGTAVGGGGGGGGNPNCPPPPSNDDPLCFGCGGGGSSGGGGGSRFSIPIIRPIDPNDIQGPSGVTVKKWMAAKDVYGYKVRYENDPKAANGPAQKVIIQVPIHPEFDIHSVRLGSFGFGKYIFNVPPNSPSYYTRLDLKDSIGLMVDVLAGINVVTNEAIWVFQSVDPTTGDVPLDAMLGFLPVNDSTAGQSADSVTGKGEGFVTFSIKPRSDVITGDTVIAQAGIIFDVNAPVMTNIEENTIDAVAPLSALTFASISGNNITLHWNGFDDTKGSGIRDYSIYVSENGGPYTFLRQVAGLTTEFTGIPGNTYCFFSIARDSVDNHEAPLKNTCEVAATLSTNGPLPVTWLFFRGHERGEDAELNWATATEINTSYYGVERSLDAVNFTEIARVSAAGNASGQTNYNYLDKNALRIDTRYIYYRLRQVDIDGRYIYSNVILIAVSKDREESVKVYPNPFTSSITLLINTTQAAKTTDNVKLYSLAGTLLYEHSLAGRQGNAPVQLNDLPALPAGIYVLTTNLNGVPSTIKIIKR